MVQVFKISQLQQLLFLVECVRSLIISVCLEQIVQKNFPLFANEQVSFFIWPSGTFEGMIAPLKTSTSSNKKLANNFA